MKPESDEHELLAEAAPGDSQHDGTVDCNRCGYEASVNKAAVIIREEYTCPECGDKTQFNNHIGFVLLMLVCALIYVQAQRACVRFKTLFAGSDSFSED